MKNLLLILFLIVVTQLGLGQNPYKSFYNEKGELKSDTTYKINNEAIPIILGGEDMLKYKIISEVVYPKQAISNGVIGSIVVGLKLTRNSDNNFIVENVVPSNQKNSVITNSIILQLKEVFKDEIFKSNNKTILNTYTLFLPFKFSFETATEVESKKSYSTKMKCFLFEFKGKPQIIED